MTDQVHEIVKSDTVVYLTFNSKYNTNLTILTEIQTV